MGRTSQRKWRAQSLPWQLPRQHYRGERPATFAAQATPVFILYFPAEQTLSLFCGGYLQYGVRGIFSLSTVTDQSAGQSPVSLSFLLSLERFRSLYQLWILSLNPADVEHSSTFLLYILISSTKKLLLHSCILLFQSLNIKPFDLSKEITAFF